MLYNYKHIKDYGKILQYSINYLKCLVRTANYSDGNFGDNTTNNSKKPKKIRTMPTEPVSCCMSGCPNCVWLDYAEEMNEFFKDGGERAMKEINEKVTDPNVKAFLLHELRMRNKKINSEFNEVLHNIVEQRFAQNIYHQYFIPNTALFYRLF